MLTRNRAYAKLMRYQQLAFETTERRPGCTVMIITVIIKLLGINKKKKTNKKKINELIKLLTKQELVVKTATEMPKTILMDSERLLR